MTDNIIKLSGRRKAKPDSELTADELIAKWTKHASFVSAFADAADHVWGHVFNEGWVAVVDGQFVQTAKGDRAAANGEFAAWVQANPYLTLDEHGRIGTDREALAAWLTASGVTP